MNDEFPSDLKVEVPMRIDMHKGRQNTRLLNSLQPPKPHDLNASLHSALSVIVSSLRRLQPEQVRDFIALLSALPDNTGQTERELVDALAELASDITSKLIDPENEIPDEAKEKLRLYRQRVGQVIRDRRLELAMSQANLAAKSGIPQSHISRLENGQHTPSYLTMESLAKALNTERSALNPGLE